METKSEGWITFYIVLIFELSKYIIHSIYQKYLKGEMGKKQGHGRDVAQFILSTIYTSSPTSTSLSILWTFQVVFNVRLAEISMTSQ